MSGNKINKIKGIIRLFLRKITGILLCLMGLG